MQKKTVSKPRLATRVKGIMIKGMLKIFLAGSLFSPSLLWAQVDTSKLKNASENVPRKDDDDAMLYSAAIGEAAVLPERILRIRFPFKFVGGSYGYDGSGKKEDLGLTLRASATAFVLEYGLNDRLTLQFLAPVIMRNEIGLDEGKFKTSETYNSNYALFRGKIAALLQSQGACSSADSCLALFDSGFALPADVEVTLPTGEKLPVKAGVPLREYADNLVRGAARPSDGKTGLGDIQTGAFYNLYKDEQFLVSLGAGIRFPTGSFSNVPSAFRGTSRGGTDFGFRFNTDYQLFKGLILSFQNQSEIMILKGKKKRTSLVDNRLLSEADATTTQAIAAGADGRASTQTFDRKGIRNVGFLKLNSSLALIDKSLRALGAYAQFNWDFDGETRLDGVTESPRSWLYSTVYGVSASGLSYGVPLSLDLDYEVPLQGKNVRIAPTIFSATVKAYYKF